MSKSFIEKIVVASGDEVVKHYIFDRLLVSTETEYLTVEPRGTWMYTAASPHVVVSRDKIYFYTLSSDSEVNVNPVGENKKRVSIKTTVGLKAWYLFLRDIAKISFEEGVTRTTDLIVEITYPIWAIILAIFGLIFLFYGAIRLDPVTIVFGLLITIIFLVVYFMLKDIKTRKEPRQKSRVARLSLVVRSFKEGGSPVLRTIVIEARDEKASSLKDLYILLCEQQGKT